MPIIHAKSPCCREIIYRFGSRRRQCRSCGRTWRIRLKRLGRKPKRSSSRIPERVLARYGRITSWAETRHLGAATASERLRGALRRLLTRPRKLPRGPYALVGDGLYFKFKRMDWVMYVVAVKPMRYRRAFFLDPVLLEGKEGYGRWRIAMDRIPQSVKKQVQAFVSDGFRGSKLIAENTAGSTSVATFTS
mgnify:FL=1